MKKSIIFGMIAGAVALSSCNDFLDDNRYPLDKQTDNPEYWNNEMNVKSQCNYFYSEYLGYGNGTSWTNDFYYRSLSDDQSAKISSGSGIIFADWDFQYAPEKNSSWDATYTVIRRCNIIINNVEVSTLPEKVKANYIGIAKLNRAFQYFDIVRKFGDVCLVTEVLDVNSPELYGPRVNRNTVMDFVLDDINYAAENITLQSSKSEFSKDMANAMKSQICLFEGAFAKYHQNDNARAEKYFNEVVNACNAVMGSYRLAPTYRENYNSSRTAILANPEMIFCKTYISGQLGHSMCKYLSSNTPICGMTKDAFDAYLFKDGKPLATTGEVKSDAGKLDANGKIDLTDVLAVRDSRLSQTIDDHLAYNGNQFTRTDAAGTAVSDPLASNTGYTIKKYVDVNVGYDAITNDGSNTVCAPIYWLANVYLDYAEARAELGQLTDTDVANTLNKLYARAGLPDQTVASLSNMNDPANNMGVSSLLWEVRRCRRCELMFDHYTRYWDLIRWHKLDLLDTTKPENIDIVLGANVSAADDAANAGVIVTDGYINSAKTTASTSTRVFSDREYLQPIGTTLLNLYNLKDIEFKQNPGW